MFIAYLFVMAMALNLTLRVWCAYGIVLATICAIGISTFSTSKQIVTSQTNTAKLYKEEEHFHNLGITFAKISKYLLTHRKMDRREFERLKVDFEKELDYLNDIAHKDEEEGILISRIGEGYRKLINEDIQKLIRDERAHLLIEKISGDINAIATIHRKEMLLHLTEISRLLRHSFITHGIGLIAALVIFLFVGYRFVKIIVIPIGILEHGVVEIRKGNLNHRIELRTGDEFQDIAEEYNRMAQTVIDREQKLKNAKDLMERLSITDAITGLTGLFNYRYFFETLGNEIERARRYKTDLSLLMLDIDHFKHYNDMHGHPRGNDALKRVACMLGDNIRRIDIPCRYGGEEFAVILPSVDKKGALIAAEKIRSSIESHPFPFRESQPKGIFTVSIGVATYPDDAKGVEELIKKADDALYRAKSTGRNRVSVA
ncbi:MAG: diguanylate cyclase [Nitrospirae bacterium]|nr:diguanylate cyclase [Nitrospirota bacterium]